jgi:hydrogenase maturation protein HypF
MLSQYLDDGRIRAAILSKEGRGSLTVDDLDRLTTQIENDVALSWTSSTGRVLDAMAAGTGVCLERTYEGEPAMVLEAVAQGGDPTVFSPSSELIVKQDGIPTVDTTGLLREALLATASMRVSDVCASFQRVLSESLASLAVEAAKERGIRRVGVTGGAAVNVRMVETIRKYIEKQELDFMQHRLVPPGDGGIALGQAAIAACRV